MAGLYTYAWQKASKAFLRAHPLCQCPHCDEGRKRVTASAVVDHHVPHRGDPVLFWDRSNWRAMAKACHDSYKQTLEKSGRIKGVDAATGLPLDPAHWWNTTGRAR